MAPLAIERIVTTSPGAMFAGAGAPAGSTPKAAQTAMPQERTSARRSLCDGAARTAAARVAGKPDLAIVGDSDRGRPEAPHRDPRLVQGGHAREHGGSKSGCRGWGQRSAGEDRAERRALVRFHRDPDTVLVGAPREHGREGRMAVLKQALKPRYGGSRLGGRNRDLVHHGGLAVS